MQIKNLSLSFGIQEVFSNININIGKNEKVGVVGVNGAGKTTFFNILTNKIRPDEGKIILDGNYRIGLLPQVIGDEVPSMDISVYDYLISGRPIEEINNALQNAYENLSATADETTHHVIFKKIDKLQQKLEYWGAYSAESDLLRIIEGMDISSDMLNTKLINLSGGQKSKVAFAKLLYSKPELILLDEPTNHLDIQTKEFVIKYLKGYKGSVYIISHDIDFLNKVTTKTLFLDKRTKNMELYDGNYNTFIKVHNEREKTLLKQAKIQQREIDRLQSTVDKYASASGNKKRMAQDREKKLAKLIANKINIAPQIKKTQIELDITDKGASIPLKFKDVNFRYDKGQSKNIINDLSFEINNGEKLLVVGRNGTGKSTLLKLVNGILTPDSGQILIGNKITIGYYAQEHEVLDNSKNIIENFSDINLSQRVLRSMLGRFLFYGDDVFKKVGVLSPGERSRVALAKLSMQGANMLLLDEPTNHLDPETQHIIAETFKSYRGTMLIVSHNPEFTNNLGIERILDLPSGKILKYDEKVIKHFDDLNNNEVVK